MTFHLLLTMPPLSLSMLADGIDSGLDFEKALDDPSMPKMSSPTQVNPFGCQLSHAQVVLEHKLLTLQLSQHAAYADENIALDCSIHCIG